MALELKQQLRLSQLLVMTPQLQQAIKLLQLSRMELVGLVQRELVENPVLEEGEGEAGGDEAADVPDAPEGAEAAGGGEAGDAAERGEPGSAETEAAAEAGVAEAAGDEAEPSQADKIADIDWQNYSEAYPQTGMREARDDEDRPGFEATLTRRPTLTEHLEWQLQLSPLTPEERAVAEFILGNLDERGYLQASVEEIAREAGADPALVERTLAQVQDFDPAGVAARDLQECLAIQVRVLGIEDPLVGRII